MFDFRYHALSLVAVFVALGVGLLLGVAIGDQELVSSAKKDLVSGLRHDVQNANTRADALQAQLNQRDEFEREAYPALVGNTLPGRRVGVLFLGSPSSDVYNGVSAALQGTGGGVGFVGVVREPPDINGLAARAGSTRYSTLGADSGLLEPFAERVGRGLVQSGALAKQERSALLSSFSGDLSGVDAVIVYRSAGAPDPKNAGVDRSLEDGLITGMRNANVPVVGVETTGTDPSQASWYRGHGMPSVDNIDHIAGRAALVFLLSEDATGTYGEKPTAEALLPRLVGTSTADATIPSP